MSAAERRAKHYAGYPCKGLVEFTPNQAAVLTNWSTVDYGRDLRVGRRRKPHSAASAAFHVLPFAMDERIGDLPTGVCAAHRPQINAISFYGMAKALLPLAGLCKIIFTIIYIAIYRDVL